MNSAITKDQIKESISLMSKICNLPNDNEKLKELGFSDDAISYLRDTLVLLNPEAHEQLNRMKDIIKYIERNGL